MSKPRRKQGRPAKYVNDRDGKPVVGLSLKSDSRYYATHSKPRIYFGKDFDNALILFQEWKARQSRETTVVLKPVNLDWEPGWLGKREPTEAEIKELHEWGNEVKKRIEHYPDSIRMTDARSESVIEVPSDLFWSTVRREITKNSFLAAQRTGLPLDRLHTLPKPQKSITIKECVKLYEEKLKRPSEEELRKLKQSWDLFTNAVAPARTLQDVTEKRFQKWVEAVWLPYEDGEGSPKTLHHKVQRVFRVINYCKTKKKRDITNCERLLVEIRALELPDLNDNNPNPITVNEFHKLLEASKGTVWEPILLTMLNCCYYPCDVRRLPVTAIDLNNGYIVFDRKKKRTPRVAVLWDRTTAILKRWMDRQPKTEWVFLSNYGTHFTDQGLRNGFRRIRKKAKLGKNVTLDRIRDGAYNHAIQHPEVTEKEVKILAGHRIAGESDAYIKRNPMMVATACKAIEQYYFGQATTGKST